jgi:Haem-binding domain
MLRKVFLFGVLPLLGIFLVIQLGRAHDNPPVTEAAPLARAPQDVMATSCGDCHTNLTKWPWYSNVAPVSWLVQNDVDGGRSHLNFSEWDHPQPGLEEVVGKIVSGEMPPWKYTVRHSDAKLTDTEKQVLINGLRQLYATNPPPPGGEDDD